MAAKRSETRETHQRQSSRSSASGCPASLGVFAVGAFLSIHQGIEGLVNPGRTTSFRVAYVILGISVCRDGASLAQAHSLLMMR